MGTQEKDIVIASCRDEEDIIVPFIDFYLDQGFDAVCLIDNGSCDRTLELIQSHPEAGKRVFWHTDERSGWDKRLLEFYQIFEGHATRWCFFIDVDEFIPLPEGGIKGYAASLPDDVTVLKMPVLEMLPENPDTEQNVFLRAHCETEYREGEPRKHVWKRVNVQKIFCGKHRIELEPYKEYEDERVFIRHYPIRSEAHFQRKLRFRMETFAAMSHEELMDLGTSTPEQIDQFLRYSRMLQGPRGWAIEKRRMSKVPWTMDTSIRDWYLKQYCSQIKGT